ncbi:hypothetical protein PF005_g16329 [Phytophthora fragariae]|uniref:Uncharacterized protein n=1 Tax=Phytophthora fragariae TaxID=53985 RepID=A0A6A4DKY1_9STRA|nr:hypothetical protein PF009_g17261 [Phytophthora fragariae]KAE8997979.1 hypothetical protein PF011_g15247 [Phytophthora fragariae]KAE9142344.1 hypothetical protein PF006_g12534 [Phytophthora fragariae]KAE9197920.1 hypothetical protein PF005_g16329 [Phytophthora fragariae]KAE9215355.1 hypothetical protein PF002_g17390 [Phytophthora fragariae]
MRVTERAVKLLLVVLPVVANVVKCDTEERCTLACEPGQFTGISQ